MVHTSFVILCVLVVYASVHANSQRLYQGAFNLVAYNGIINKYFDRADFDPDGNPKYVKNAASVGRQLDKSPGKIMISATFNSQIPVQSP